MGFLDMLGMKNHNDIELELESEGFKINKKWDGLLETMMLCLDHKKLFIVPSTCRKKNYNRTVINFDDIIDVELIIDTQDVVKKSGLGRAVVGGILLGGVGAIVGGVTGSTKTVTEFKDVDIQLKLKNPIEPLRKFNINSSKTKSTTMVGKMVMEKAQDCYETLLRVIAQGAATVSNKQ